MIKFIIKRNGTKEPFTPNKINGWGEWASKTLGDSVDWSSLVLHVTASLPETCSSEDLQNQLIKECLNSNSWLYNRMAGRLYVSLMNKQIYGSSTPPSVKEVHTKLHLANIMLKLNYSDEEYAQVEKMIDHDRDLESSYYELQSSRSKYALQDRVNGIEYETQQFIYMRMAMALAEEQPKERRMRDVKKWYDMFSLKKLSAPTPNFVNLGTKLKGFSSCILYKTNDQAPSLAIGDHIAYTMTCMAAGIGANVVTRGLGEPVRGGLIKHLGKLPYYRALNGAVHANMQNGRAGACTVYYSCFDPEVETICQLKNPMQTEDKKIRGMDYNFQCNKFFAKKAATGDKIFTFSCQTAPDLWEAFYSPNQDLFEELYNKYEANPNFKKHYVDARNILLTVLNESYETGRAYLNFVDEMNTHTPFKDKIYSSNLCCETMLPTKGYDNMMDLYSDNLHREGEIASCSLAAINVSNIKNDKEYEEVMYYALLMIDKCIHLSDYPLHHLGQTAKARLSAGVGVINLAHYMAKNHKSYMSKEGKEFMHELAERHMYFAVKASLQLGKELGNAPWINRTKWGDGWMPIDSYNKNVDKIVEPVYQYDWETLRQEVVENGGIRNSVLIAHMPTESSSNAAGATNGLYPIRDFALLKGNNNNITYWAAPDGEELAQYYERAWDVPYQDMIDCYAIFQKFTDQGISGDLYRKIIDDDVVPSSEMIKVFLYCVKYGLKSRYYMNTLTTEGVDLNAGDVGCASGACSL